MKTPNLRHRRQPQRGLSLIDLLIGIAIGLLVCMAALMTLETARSTSTTVRDSTSLYQDAALVWRVLGHHLQQAGAHGLVATSVDSESNQAVGIDVVFADNFNGFGRSPASQRIFNIFGVNSAGGRPDMLLVSRAVDPNAGTANCAGAPATGGALNIRFRVQNGELFCDDGTRVLAMVRGVEDFQLSYAVQQANSIRYTNTPIDWSAVVAVRVCLQLVGSAAGQASAATPGCQGETADDGRIRRAFWRVFKLRNAIS